MNKPTICLCVMVKNEAQTLPRLIESARPYIDRVLICDTGSTDGTQKIAKRLARQIGGGLIEHEWVSFGHNRSLMLEVARGRADWLLLMDADWTLDVEGGALDGLDPLIGCYNVASAGGEPRLVHKVLVRGDLPWKAVGAVHEYIDCDEPFTAELLAGVSWTHHADGGARADRADEQPLREEVNASARATFYLAQTLRESGHTAEAADMYLHRARLGGWLREVSYSLYQAGMILDDIGLLLRAWATCPDRLEPLYEVAWRLRAQGCHEAVRQLLSPYAIVETPTPDGGFVHAWVYEWGLTFELALAIHNSLGFIAARGLYLGLLIVETLPENYRLDIESKLKAEDEDG